MAVQTPATTGVVLPFVMMEKSKGKLWRAVSQDIFYRYFPGMRSEKL